MALKKKIRWYKKLKVSHWLTIIGGITIFMSWIFEKKHQSWIDEKENLKRSQLVIDITEANRSLYELAFYSEGRKSVIDTPQIAFIQQRLARVYLDLLTWSKGRAANNSKDATEYYNLVNAKRQIDEANRKHLETHEYDKINKSFNNVAQVFGENYMSLDNAYSKRVDLVDENEEYWTNVFIFFYVVGSILLGLAYISEKISTTKE